MASRSATRRNRNRSRSNKRQNRRTQRQRGGHGSIIKDNCVCTDGTRGDTYIPGSADQCFKNGAICNNPTAKSWFSW